MVFLAVVAVLVVDSNPVPPAELNEPPWTT